MFSGKACIPTLHMVIHLTCMSVHRSSSMASSRNGAEPQNIARFSLGNETPPQPQVQILKSPSNFQIYRDRAAVMVCNRHQRNFLTVDLVVGDSETHHSYSSASLKATWHFLRAGDFDQGFYPDDV